MTSARAPADAGEAVTRGKVPRVLGFGLFDVFTAAVVDFIDSL